MARSRSGSRAPRDPAAWRRCSRCPSKPHLPAIHRERELGVGQGHPWQLRRTPSAAGNASGSGRRSRICCRICGPRIGWDLRTRVGAAVGCLIVAKLANVYVPILFKAMVDALTPHLGAGAPRPAAHHRHRGADRAAARLWPGADRDPALLRIARRHLRPVAQRAIRTCRAADLPPPACAVAEASISTGRPAASPARSSAAPRASSSCCSSCCSTCCRPCSRSSWSAASCGRSTTGASRSSTVGHHRRLCRYTLRVTEWRIKYRRDMNESGPERQHQGGRLAC